MSRVDQAGRAERRLVAMANDIADYFASAPDRATAVDGIVTHMRRYWVPRMRERICAHLAAGGAGLSDLARSAVAQLGAADAPARPGDP